jgi:protein subunit release factor A
MGVTSGEGTVHTSEVTRLVLPVVEELPILLK